MTVIPGVNFKLWGHFTIAIVTSIWVFLLNKLMSISSGNFFSYKCELPKNFHIYLYDVFDISLLTFFRWLGWYHWARFYVVIKIIHGFWIKVSYKKIKSPGIQSSFSYYLNFLLRKIKHVRKEIVLQSFKTHITLLSFHWNCFIILRPKQTGIPVSIYSVHLKEYFSNCKASLFRQC